MKTVIATAILSAFISQNAYAGPVLAGVAMAGGTLATGGTVAAAVTAAGVTAVAGYTNQRNPARVVANVGQDGTLRHVTAPMAADIENRVSYTPALHIPQRGSDA